MAVLGANSDDPDIPRACADLEVCRRFQRRFVAFLRARRELKAADALELLDESFWRGADNPPGTVAWMSHLQEVEEAFEAGAKLPSPERIWVLHAMPAMSNAQMAEVLFPDALRNDREAALKRMDDRRRQARRWFASKFTRPIPQIFPQVF